MSKRTAETEADTEAEAGGKRQKLEQSETPKDVEEVWSAQQLQQLLAFQQDALPQLRAGIRAFKVFLESIVYAEDKLSTTKQQAILRDFLDAQRPSTNDTEEPFLPHLMQTWSFAAQTNNDSLLSSASSVLALLLKTISSLINLREHGLLLGRTLLQQTHLKLIARGLSAPRPKEHVIAPCLRLLTEVVSFDGGVLAKQLYSVRSFTLDPKILSRNLSFTKVLAEDPEETRRRPAVRTIAIRYLIANLTFQSSSAKAELLKYSNVFRSLFEHVKHDPVDVLHELLAAFKTNVLQDEGLQRQSKSFVLHDGNLLNIASLYRHEQSANHVGIEQRERKSDRMAYDFLRYVCTEPSAGLLRASSWYPPGSERSTEEQHQGNEQADIDLGLDSVEWFNKYHAKVPVRNSTLAKFALGLRPYGSILESELLLDMFRAAPELVANYFVEKSAFAFDPKLSATWIGYSAFLYSAMQLPVPSRMGPGADHSRVPPPTSIMLENILPRPLTQQVLTKCLNQKVELITFITIRLLALALQKLRAVVARLRDIARDGGTLWQDAATRLVTSFSFRFPKMKDILATWKSTAATNRIQQEATLRLIRLCYQVTPHIALEEKLDVSSALNEALYESHLSLSGTSGADATESELGLMSLNHLLQISRHTPDMRWFSKSSAGSLSPCGSLLKLLVTTTESNKVSAEMRELLASILRDHGLLQLQTEPSGLDALVTSLASLDEQPASEAVFEFIDDVFDRTCKRPIKYEDDMKQIAEAHKGVTTKPNSLIWATILEQWPFVVARGSERASEIATWIGRFALTGRMIGEDSALLDHVTSQIGSRFLGASRALDDAVVEDLQSRLTAMTTPSLVDSLLNESLGTATPRIAIRQAGLAPPLEDESHKGLHAWSTYPDIATAVANNTLPALICCLSSFYPEVCSQALTNVRNIMARIQPLLPSTAETTIDPLIGTTTPTVQQHKSNIFPDATPIYLLLGILSNTSSTFLSRRDPPRSVPRVATSYAAAAAKVLLDPFHPVYDKVNAFHTRAPRWDVSRIASHWINKVLLEAPSDDVSISLTSSSSKGPNTVGKEINSTTEDGLEAVRAEQEDAAATPYAAASHNEIHFLLAVILGSLHTPEDVELLRSRGSLEPLLTLLTAGNVHVLPLGLRELVLKIVWRVVLIEGGATTLITRCGVLALIEGLLAGTQLNLGRQHAESRSKLLTEAGLRALAACVWEKCDQSRVMEWSDGVVATVRGLTGNENLAA